MKSFWVEICGEYGKRKHSTTKIHNPTLRLLARWVSLIVFPRGEVRCAPNEDLKCLYAMVKKKRYAPVLDIVHHWMGTRATNTPISITSFVTRIAANLGLLENAQLDYLSDDTSHYVGEQHFVQAHFMKRDAATGKLVMTWFGHNLELPLPAPQFDMYTIGEPNHAARCGGTTPKHWRCHDQSPATASEGVTPQSPRRRF